jgi:phospholipase/carboxylesterase/glyoxalase family protein
VTDFVHRFEPAAQTPGEGTLLLLHGTGGDENDLLPLGRAISPRVALLAPRGQVLENGMPRFFRRIAEGVFDHADLVARSHQLADFVAAAAKQHGFDPARVYAVGFSNGANVAAAVMLLRPETLAGGILFRPMVPFEPETPPRLAGRRVLVSAGRADALVPAAQSERLAELLRQAGADVTLHWSPGGHALERPDLAAAGDWWRAGARSAAGAGK